MMLFKTLKFKMSELNNSNNPNNSNNEANYISVPNINKINPEKLIPNTNKKKKKLKSYIIAISKELFLLIIIIYSIYRYKKGLTVPEIEEKDFDMDPSFFMNLFYDCLGASFYVSIALFLIEFKICKIYLLFLIIVVYLYFFIRYRGETLEGHGTYNTLVFLIGLFLGQIVIFILFGLKFLYKKKKSIPIIIGTCIFIFSFLIYKIKVEYKVKCKDWEYGLNNTKLNNDDSYPCSIIIPNHNCYLNFLGPLCDFSKGKKCTSRKQEEKMKLKKASKSKYITSTTKRIGFPITTHKENFQFMKQQEAQNLYNEVMANLVDMDNQEQLEELGEKEKPEVVLDYTNNKYGDIYIHVNYDKDLAKERKELETETYPLYENIIFIFLDGISRAHFPRVYKKSYEFIDKFMKYEGCSNEEDPSQKYHGFQFFKQHSFKEFTLGNVLPMFYGCPYYSKKVESITGEIKDKGYITCNLNGLCNKEAFYYNWQLKEDMERKYIEFDHEMFSINCDPNIFDASNPHTSILLGESSIFRRCLYGKENVEYLFEYGRQFLETYNDNRKYLRISIPNGHELSGQVSKYVDEPLYEFLNYIYNNNLLKNTSLIIASDHGLNILVLYKLLHSQDQEIEVNNPLLMFILPDKKDKSYDEQYGNIYNNQQIFITPFDVYHSIKHIIHGKDQSMTKKYFESVDEKFEPKKHYLGSSLFNRIDQSERYCQNYFDIHECICKVK